MSDTTTTRRRFIAVTPLAGFAMLAACSPPAPPVPAPAPSPASAPMPAPTTVTTMVDEASPQAMSLGYVADASRVDKAKFAGFMPGSQCSNCALYQGQAGVASGPCAIFPGQQVAAGGWCSSWAKKA